MEFAPMDQKHTTFSPEFVMNLTPDQIQPLFASLNPDQVGLPDQVRTLLDENRQLRQQITDLQAHVAKLEKTEREVMTLVKAPTREKIVHDLRNVLNELVLLQAIAGHDD
jgi:hypothetical protein